MGEGRFLDTDAIELQNITGTPRDTHLVHDPMGDLMRQPTTPLPLSSPMDGQMKSEYAAAERRIIITVPSIPGGRGVHSSSLRVVTRSSLQRS